MPNQPKNRGVIMGEFIANLFVMICMAVIPFLFMFFDQERIKLLNNAEISTLKTELVKCQTTKK